MKTRFSSFLSEFSGPISASRVEASSRSSPFSATSASRVEASSRSLEGSPHGSPRTPHVAYAPFLGGASRRVDGISGDQVLDGAAANWCALCGAKLSCAAHFCPRCGRRCVTVPAVTHAVGPPAPPDQAAESERDGAELTPLGSGYVAGGGLNLSADDAVLLAHLRAGVQESRGADAQGHCPGGGRAGEGQDALANVGVRVGSEAGGGGGGGGGEEENMGQRKATGDAGCTDAAEAEAAGIDVAQRAGVDVVSLPRSLSLPSMC
jgi:hypothetical protein